MDSFTIYLHLDSRKIQIVSTPMVDNNPVLMHKSKQISFDKFISYVLDYGKNYHQRLKELTDYIVKNVNRGNKNNAKAKIQDRFKKLESEMSSNSFAKNVLIRIQTDYLSAKAEGEKTHTNIKIANIENNLKKKYESDLGALEKLFSFINNDFYEVNNSEFSIFSQVIMKVKNNKRLIMIPINESLEPLANAFIYAVYTGNLWIHTCQRCGKLFLSDTDEKYCQAKACQHQILLDKWKNDREKNMNNETSHTLTIFRGYLRKQKNCLKNAGASEQMLSMIEHKIKELGKEATERASVFKDTNTTPDEKFLNFCEETKKQFKSECDRLKKEIKESKNPTQPT